MRHGSSAGRLDRLVGGLAPDLVVIGDLLAPADALARLAEVRGAAPDAQVVVLSSSPEAGWLADALRAKAVRRAPGPDGARRRSALVLREVLAERAAEVRELRPRLRARRGRPAGAAA